MKVSAPPATVILGVTVATALALCKFAAVAVAQAESPYRIRVESNQAQAAIRVKSNLVLVPAFVYDKRRMERVTDAVRRCTRDNAATFYKLGASKPYLQSECAPGEIVGLSANDFHVLEDGVEQKIQSVTVERWPLIVRDSVKWHVDQSSTPSGIWSSTDLANAGIMPASDQQFYVIAYMPPNSEVGSCHKIEVKVDRPHAVVFARSDYCTGQSPSDPLSGTQFSKQMERDMASAGRGKVDLSMQAGYFYIGADLARVDVSLEFPWGQLDHKWNTSNWSLGATIGVLGMVYQKDGTLVARFSDLLYPSYWPMYIHGRTGFREGTAFNPGQYADPQTLEIFLSRWDPVWLPARYETQLDLSPDRYDLRVVLSDGRKFGRTEEPLLIDRYDWKGLALSSIMLCKRFRDAAAAAQEAAAANFAPQYVPLVSKVRAFIPTADTLFKPGEPLIAYFEIYEPMLTVQPATRVEAHLRIVDAKTGEVKKDFPPVDVASYERPGSATISIAVQVPFHQLPEGVYRLEVRAADSAGRSTVWRSADFSGE